MQDPNTTTLQSLPPLPGETEAPANHLNPTETAKNSNSKVAFAFIGIIFIAVGVGGYMLYKSVSDQLGLNQAATPAEVIDALNSSVISDDQKSLLPAAGVVPKQDIDITNATEFVSEIAPVDEFDQLNSQVNDLLDALNQVNNLSEQLNRQINQVNQRVDSLEGVINSQSEQSQLVVAELDDIKKLVQSLDQKVSDTARSAKTSEQTRVVQPSPPKTLSSAIWQGRQAVLVNDRAAIRMFYVGDTVANWQIEALNSHSIVWRSLLSNERITAEIGG
ncbi:hypothetical protein THIAE_06085 [Thiomicrospira aerophila AL3]|uniref:Uncharacterized protein n=1 Tax=Thiomicrospira aerophila AL3 TaxID=717772 RepID=W0DZ81_9GAMM|nr:hypothetical protein [Thiomicrospira aerophila]AHF02289.1 hypothetical protein THIAE_06085 [Thiomicrospira aerophila AL3]